MCVCGFVCVRFARLNKINGERERERNVIALDFEWIKLERNEQTEISNETA